MPDNVPEVEPEAVTGFIDKVRSLQAPSAEDLVDLLKDMGSIQAILLLACGLVYMLQGWKTFKILVVVNAALLGAAAGAALGGLLESRNMPLFGGIAGGLLFAVVSWPLMKLAVSLMGGLAGGLIGYGVWNYAANAAGKASLAEHAWAGAIIGLITLGLLTFVIFRLVVMIFTSFQGGIMVVVGSIALLLKNEGLHEDLSNALMENSHVLPLLIIVLALIGFAFQYTAATKKAKKKKKATEGEL